MTVDGEGGFWRIDTNKPLTGHVACPSKKMNFISPCHTELFAAGGAIARRWNRKGLPTKLWANLFVEGEVFFAYQKLRCT